MERSLELRNILFTWGALGVHLGFTWGGVILGGNSKRQKRRGF